MKIKIERNGEIIEVDKVSIQFDDCEYHIKETTLAYKDDGNIEIIKISFEKSSSIAITPCVSNHIRIK